MRNLFLLLALLVLPACWSQEDRSQFELQESWEYKEVFYDIDEDPRLPWIEDFLYEFEIPLPSESKITFTLSDIADISSYEPGNENYFYFKIRPYKTADSVEALFEQQCREVPFLREKDYYKLIKQNDDFEIFEALSKCVEGMGYIIKGKQHFYYTWMYNSQNLNSQNNMQYAITHIRKNPRAFSE